MTQYCRADVLRILHITAKQLVGWQRAGLAPISDTFTFYDLLQLKKIRDLRAKRVRPAAIRESSGLFTVDAGKRRTLDYVIMQEHQSSGLRRSAISRKH